MSQDAEDGLDQLLGSWNSMLAQQLSRLHASLDQGLRNHEVRAERKQEKADARAEAERRAAEAEVRRIEAQRTALYEWESANRNKLNEGFEYILNQSILAAGAVERLDDRHLARAWVVGEQLQNHDPGYAPRLAQAQRIMSDEWSRRHPDTQIQTVADQMVNHVVITYADRTADLDNTLAAFRKAGIPTDLVAAQDPDAFRAAHEGGFHVQARLGGSWDGWDEARIQDAVMQDTYAGLDCDTIDDTLAYIKERGVDQAGIDESVPADRRAAGIEPSSASEVERGETRDAAPQATRATTPVGTSATASGAVHAETDGASETHSDGTFDPNTSELGGDDVFGAFDVATESSMAADQAGHLNPTPQSAAHGSHAPKGAANRAH